MPIIQAKRFNEGKVREKDIRNFIGAMSGDTNKGVFVTTSEFDKLAMEKAKNAHHKIILIDGNKLVSLMHEFNVGIQVKTIYEIKEIDEDFFDEQ
jgi:restriction system protein